MTPMLTFEDALSAALDLAAPVGAETAALAAATGRALAADVHASSPLPPFDNAAMDGYALRTADLVGAGPWRLRVAGRIAAGDAAGDALPEGAARRIFTGAPTPPEADAVVMQEHVVRLDGAIELLEAPRPGLNIRRVGEDVAPGGRVLKAGTLIGPREAALLAAIGRNAAPVHRRIRVAILGTGSELCAPGRPLGPAQIWDANRTALSAALLEPWIDLEDLGTEPDEPDRLAAALGPAASRSDLVISTGGASVGDEDHAASVFQRLGGEMRVLKIAMKPGKPLLIGRLGGAVYLGLPGNPMAALIGWLTIGAPVARRLSGRSDVLAPTRLVEVDFHQQRWPGRREFRPSRIIGRGASGLDIAQPLAERHLIRLSLLAAADGLISIPAEAEEIRPGQRLEYAPL